jgi:hypothetical protein
MPKGKNLGELLCGKLKDAGIEFTRVPDSRRFVNSLRIHKTEFLVKYANESSDRHWFGFSIEDINKSRKYSFAILLIGSDQVERIYCIPYETLVAFIKQGKPVWVGSSNYEQYEATIFPQRNYIMKVEHWPDDEFEIQQYQVLNISEYFLKFHTPKDVPQP